MLHPVLSQVRNAWQQFVCYCWLLMLLLLMVMILPTMYHQCWPVVVVLAVLVS